MVWNVGDIIQIDPESDLVFAACLMVVTEPKPWGAQGLFLVPDAPSPKTAYYRVKFENGVRVGRVSWFPADEII